MFRDTLPQLLNLKTWELLGLLVGLIFVIELGRITFEAIYNVYFHPLKHYPGSIWDITFPILTQYNIMKGRVLHRLKKRHEQYGEIVRIAPHTLSYISPQAWKDIYGHANDLPKAVSSAEFLEHSVFSAPKGEHARQRKAIAPAFSDKSLTGQEQLIRVYVDLLVQRLHETSGQVTDAVRWFNMVAFDLIADLAFGQSLQGLEKNETNQWIENIQNVFHFTPFLILVNFSRICGLLVRIFLGSKMKAVKAKQDAYVQELLRQRLSKHDRGDFMDHLIGKLPEKELVANADLFMLAGSHTSSVLLSGVTFWLLKTPVAYAKVRKEVRDAFDRDEQITFKTAERLSYLQAVIDEGLRIFPPAPLAIERKTVIPTKICGQIVPSDTILGIPHLSAYHSEMNFYKAKEFHPERWIDKNNPNSPFHNDRREVFHPFSYGPRNCIGQSLAYHEMRLILAKILWNFDTVLEPECSKWNEQRIFGVWESPPLKVRYFDRFGNVKS